MPFVKGQQKRGGRKKGTPNKVTLAVKAFARSVVEEPRVQATTLRQARAGTLPAPILVLLFHYAVGKPTERLEISNPDMIDVGQLAGALTQEENQILLRAMSRIREQEGS